MEATGCSVTPPSVLLCSMVEPATWRRRAANEVTTAYQRGRQLCVFDGASNATLGILFKVSKPMRKIARGPLARAQLGAITVDRKRGTTCFASLQSGGKTGKVPDLSEWSGERHSCSHGAPRTLLIFISGEPQIKRKCNADDAHFIAHRY